MKDIKRKKSEKPIVPTKLGAFVILAAFFLCIACFGLKSAFDSDKTVSDRENRSLASFPEISIKSVFDGSFSQKFDEYYSDTFPCRDFFLTVNSEISDFFSKTGSGDEEMVIVEKREKDDFAGQDITYDE